MNIQSYLKNIDLKLGIVLALPLVLIFIGCKSSELREIADSLQQVKKPLDNKTVVAGLKQALEIGISNSVAKTGRIGGFSDNPLIHIAIPQELNKVESTLRKIGLNQYLDRFERQMNRAAESASIEAKRIFISSISQMSFSDAMQILNGQDDAATQYFKQTTSEQLRSKFRPVIQQSMHKVGFYQDYKTLLKTYDSIPFTRKPDLNIESYILQKTLDGLFLLVAQEEKKIRQDPTARVTDLLQRVFGN